MSLTGNTITLRSLTLTQITRMRAVVSLLFILIFHSGVNAFTLDNKLRDKSMEKRATSLFEIIRCPICSGESLSESGSQIAYDMREAIRKKNQ